MPMAGAAGHEVGFTPEQIHELIPFREHLCRSFENSDYFAHRSSSWDFAGSPGKCAIVRARGRRSAWVSRLAVDVLS